METTLVKFDAAKRALAEARSIDEVKDIRDKAEALRLYVRQQGDGLEMQNDIAEIKLRAERRAGELLAEMEKQTGGDAMRARSQLATEVPPTLTDIGISKSQSSRWQRAARIPVETFEQHVAKVKAGNDKELTSAGIQRLAKKLERERRKSTTESRQAELPESINLICGDFADICPTFESESFDAIITDPPYAKASLHLYDQLAEQAARLLKPGGVLLAMAGQSYLPVIYSSMSEHLTYHWTLCYLTPGGQSSIAVSNHRHVNTFWKPVLWFVKGKYTSKQVGDVIRSDKNDKRYHEWGQSERGIAEVVDKLTDSGDFVLDPFLGGGTTAIVCVKLGCRFTGIDIDPGSIETTRGRLSL